MVRRRSLLPLAERQAGRERQPAHGGGVGEGGARSRRPGVPVGEWLHRRLRQHRRENAGSWAHLPSDDERGGRVPAGRVTVRRAGYERECV